MVKFFSEERLISDAEIADFEEFIGMKLPNEYRTHLLIHNGGQCEPNIFSFIEAGKETTSRVDWFLALYEGEYDNLVEYVKIYKKDAKRLPNRMLPIAHDDGGNLICISCIGDDCGFIYFWDHENEQHVLNSNQESSYILLFIAESFQKFLNGLH